MKYKNVLIEWLYDQLQLFNSDWVFQLVFIIISIGVLAVALGLIYWAIRNILSPIIHFINGRYQSKWMDLFLDKGVFKWLFVAVSLYILKNIYPFFLYRVPSILMATEMVINLLLEISIAIFLIHLINAFVYLGSEDNDYKTIAVKTFGQLAKIVLWIVAVVLVISTILQIDPIKVITGLGAVTAVLILLFKDTIVGFVTGIQVAYSQLVKVGDWIKVPKYEADGYIKEIDLMSVKIENFDKTVSSIPSYDLVATEIINYDPMTTGGTRRIKRAIVFNVKSFRFLSDQDVQMFQQYHLLEGYIKHHWPLIKAHNQTQKINTQILGNGLNFTNIGLFRNYVQAYIANHPKIDPKGQQLVRQLQMTEKGLALEIYCFTTTAIWKDFEEIQSDIFDHLLTIATQFGLDVAHNNSSN